MRPMVLVNITSLKCNQKLGGKCLFRQINCSFSKSVLAKRLINKLEVTCEYCQFKTHRCNLMDHYDKCKQYEAVCPIATCIGMKMSRSKMANHLCSQHKNEVNRKLKIILELFDPVQTGPIQTSSKQSICIPKPSFRSIDTQLNSNEIQARLGATGKYNCDKQLDGVCRCCNGIYRTTAGCNCSSCMLLDVKTRNLPFGWLINSGFCARKGETNLFYCGRFELKNEARLDGYCGPLNGPNCAACKKLDIFTKNNSRYSNLNSH